MFTSLKSSIELFLLNVAIYAILQNLRIYLDAYLPDSMFSDDNKIWQCHSWEDGGKIYDRLFKVSIWKDSLPTVNSINNLNKKHMVSVDVKYLRLFIREMNLAESHHLRSIISTFIFALWNPWDMFLIFFTLSFLVQMPFIIIQRYNRPRMRKVLRSIEKRNLQITDLNHSDNESPRDNVREVL